jgi:hypothetical protein
VAKVIVIVSIGWLASRAEEDVNIRIESEEE